MSNQTENKQSEIIKPTVTKYIKLPLLGKVKQNYLLGLLAVIVLGAGGITYYQMTKTKPKLDLDALTIKVKSQDLVARITASGTVVPIQSVNISPKTSGRLQKLLVEQGDRVESGQLIAVMENKELQLQVRQAKANWEQAKARLADAVRGTRYEQIEQAQARVNQAEGRLNQALTLRPQQIEQAKARLDQAESKLAQARIGRPEEIEQAKAQVEDAQGRIDRSNDKLKNYEQLAKDGAINQEQLKEIRTENITAKTSLRQAQKRLEIVKKGSRPEEIEQLQAAIAEAKSSLTQAETANDIPQLKAALAEAKSSLTELKNGKRREEIEQLRAAVSAAEAQWQAAEVQLKDTEIRTPFAGIITQKYANEGAFVTPTTSASSSNSATSSSIIALAKDLELKIKVTEVDLSTIKLGQETEIMADAYPDKTFKGRVRLIAPEAVIEQNVTSFEVRVKIDPGQTELLSGMNVNVVFLGDPIKNALVVPTVAIVTEKGQTGVLIPDANNEAVFTPVKVGTSIEDQTQILEGIKSGDRIFLDKPKEKKKPDDPSKKSAQRQVERTGQRAIGVQGGGGGR
jgi:HlyD family secretion protein